MMGQGSEPVGRDEPTEAGIDVDGTAEIVFEKVEDGAKDADAKSDVTDTSMKELVEDSRDDEVKDWSATFDSDEDSETDTEDEFEQQWRLGEHLYSVTMLADSCIPEEGRSLTFLMPALLTLF